ncbi:MAG: cobalamin biosynthesis protein CobQ [Candidatus Levybacteria bacterium]|nr:cobalamin biosynthesis protein CobQ [Candidatus Levybacteria bacterium]
MVNGQLSLTIGWLYPDLMSTYGDRGNIITLQRRCEWRNIKTQIRRLDVGFDEKRLATCDILFMGGAQDTQQKIVSRDFSTEKRILLKKLIEAGIPGLYICGAYQFLGKYYKEADGTIIKGLGILDLYTKNPGENSPRLIGNIAIKILSTTLVGFENHGGRTYIADKELALGKVVKGFGNNGEDRTEGIMYKNSVGTYLHGPVLPKNPKLADFLIAKALEVKYENKIKLEPLDDTLELKARTVIAKRLGAAL